MSQILKKNSDEASDEEGIVLLLLHWSRREKSALQDRFTFFLKFRIRVKVQNGCLVRG